MNPIDSPLRLVVNNETPGDVVRGLYLITDEGDRLVERTDEALGGGVSLLQFRRKSGDPDERFGLGLELKRLCEQRGIPFIVNDDLELAKELDADGVHLGQEDGDPREARRVLGPKKLIGVSTHTLDEALAAEAAGADYIGFGAIYPTRSKEITHLAGPEQLAGLKERVKIPVVAIGGIARGNAAAVIEAGADAVAIISAVLSSPRPAMAAAELTLLFNRRAPFPRGSVLTVAGSDSGGGAGIQADIKTVTLLGSYAASAVTALTAQNTRGVSGIHPVPVSFVEEQLRAVFSDIPVHVVKTGMLYSAETITAVVEQLAEFEKRISVVDPVMIATGGAPLMDREALDAMRQTLVPAAYLITPNVPEAEKLTGCAINNIQEMEEAARVLHSMGAANVVIKGGHLPEGDAVDILFDGQGFHRFPAPRILSRNTHGTGCTFASAVAAFLAQGEPLLAAIAAAKQFITAAIRSSHSMGKGHGPVNHYQASKER